MFILYDTRGRYLLDEKEDSLLRLPHGRQTLCWWCRHRPPCCEVYVPQRRGPPLSSLLDPLLHLVWNLRFFSLPNRNHLALRELAILPNSARNGTELNYLESHWKSPKGKGVPHKRIFLSPLCIAQEVLPETSSSQVHSLGRERVQSVLLPGFNFLPLSKHLAIRENACHSSHGSTESRSADFGLVAAGRIHPLPDVSFPACRDKRWIFPARHSDNLWVSSRGIRGCAGVWRSTERSNRIPKNRNFLLTNIA